MLLACVQAAHELWNTSPKQKEAFVGSSPSVISGLKKGDVAIFDSRLVRTPSHYACPREDPSGLCGRAGTSELWWVGSCSLPSDHPLFKFRNNDKLAAQLTASISHTALIGPN